MATETSLNWIETSPHRTLASEWRLMALAGAFTLGAGTMLVGLNAGWLLALRWALLPSLGIAYTLWFLRHHLPENHAGDRLLLTSLGWGNILTVVRAFLLACLAGFLLLPRPTGLAAWAPGLLYTLAVLLDFFDGYVARITHHATRLGERLDMEFDGWGMLLASLLAVAYGQAPGWYVLVGLARYLYVGGLALRNRLGLVNHPMPSNVSRRLFAGLQMGLSFVLLWPLFGPSLTHWAAAFFSLPFLLGFAKDWLLTCGWLKPGFGVRWAKQADWLLHWLPLGLRLAAVGLGITAMLQMTWPDALWMFGLVCVLWVGVTPRLAAVLGMLLLGLLPMSALTIALLALYSGILYLGGGKWAFWTPEERFILRRAGEEA
jgi:CDP-diacylglycerol--glycerol-3-phosphate 3-phosphatidyltransferase